MDNDQIFKTKQMRCRFHHYDLTSKSMFEPDAIKHTCIRNGIKDDEIIRDVDEATCETCEHYSSKFIEYPITVTNINIKEDDPMDRLYKEKIGMLAKVRLADNDDKKTYLGIFLGDIPHSPRVSHNRETGELNIQPFHNPAIFIPELKRIVFGIESWWCVVEEQDIDKEITDELIQNQWYVQLAKRLDNND